MFAERVVQIWQYDSDPNNNSQVQVLNNTGTASPRSVTQFGDNDLFYCDESGLRSLRARDGSNAAATTDIGVPVDTLMVLKTPALREAFGIQVWAKSLTEPGGGYVQSINSKSSTQDGHNPHLAVLDELHAHKDRGLYDVIDSAFGARRNPLLWCITTAGFDTTSVCYEQRTFVTKVLIQGVDTAKAASTIKLRIANRS